MKPFKLKIQNHSDRMQLVGILADNGYNVSIKKKKANFSFKNDKYYVVIEERSKDESDI